MIIIVHDISLYLCICSPGLIKIELAQKILCNYSLIRYAFAPSLVGLASLVLEILLLFVLLQNSLSNHGLLVHGVKK